MAFVIGWEPKRNRCYRVCAVRLRCLLLLWLGVLSTPARAAPAADGVPGPVDTMGLSHVDRAEVEDAGAVGARVDLTWTHRPLRLYVEGLRRMAIQDRAGLRVWLDVGVYKKRLMLSLAAGGSFQRYTEIGQGLTQTAGRTSGYDIGAEDIRLMLKGLAVDHKIVGFAIAGGINFATGDKRGFRSDGQYGAELRFILDLHWKVISVVAGLGFRLHGNYNIINYLPNEDEVRTQAGPELTWGGAIVLTPHRFVLLAAEAVGSETMAPRILAETRTAQVGGTLRLRPAPSIEIGLSASTSVAFESLRPEQVRALVSIVWHPLAAKVAVGGDRDRDRDGVPDSVDGCPNEPEDRDGFEDQDGCPELDNDKDGVPDDLDRCPNEPEDRDGFDDSDGCPELDNDKDGIPDKQDRCPNQAELRDQYFDGDGCPNDDVDGDGIPNDKDGCPNAAETKNGYNDEDGCPDVAPDNNTPPPAVPDIGRTGEVGFPLRSAVVDSEGAKDLVKVIDYLKAKPKASLELEGRADKREPAKLAAERAKNVRSFLVGLGIAGERLIIKPARTRKQESSVEWRIVER